MIVSIKTNILLRVTRRRFSPVLNFQVLGLLVRKSQVRVFQLSFYKESFYTEFLNFHLSAFYTSLHFLDFTSQRFSIILFQYKDSFYTECTLSLSTFTCPRFTIP